MRKTIKINVNPHIGQKEVHNSPARFRVLAAGRRWGKTRLGVNECLDVASKGGRAWWVAPSYKMSEVGWRPLRRMGSQLGAEIRRADRQIVMPNGGEISVRSADNPDSLRGEGLDFIVVDECAFIKEDAWNEALRPALADRQGGALLCSTPKGRNLFWRLFQLANSQEGWQSWSFPTSANPYIEESEIEAAKDLLPERIFLQEFMAEFLEDSGTVFRNVMPCAIATEDEPNEAGQYVMGVDWGKHNDFTVITVLDTTPDVPRMVYTDRFNQIDYQLQLGRLLQLVDKYNPYSVIAEKNSIGEPLVEQLQRANVPVEAFNTTNQSKTVAIEALSLAFERNDIEILNDPVLVGELQAYELSRLPSGAFRYNAPEGLHDDMVMSLALAYSGVSDGLGLLL